MSRYKFDRSREFIPVYNFGCGHLRSVAVQFISEPESCQGTENLIACRCACPGLAALRICLRSRSKSKKCDKQLTHIVRVSNWAVINYFIINIFWSRCEKINTFSKIVSMYSYFSSSISNSELKRLSLIISKSQFESVR